MSGLGNPYLLDILVKDSFRYQPLSVLPNPIWALFFMPSIVGTQPPLYTAKMSEKVQPLYDRRSAVHLPSVLHTADNTSVLSPNSGEDKSCNCVPLYLHINSVSGLDSFLLLTLFLIRANKPDLDQNAVFVTVVLSLLINKKSPMLHISTGPLLEFSNIV